jgi:hypothetical protein
MFEMWSWRRTQEVSWTDRARNEVLLVVKKGRIILPPLDKRKANWIGYTLPRNCGLKHIIEGK